MVTHNTSNGGPEAFSPCFKSTNNFESRGWKWQRIGCSAPMMSWSKNATTLVNITFVFLMLIFLRFFFQPIIKCGFFWWRFSFSFFLFFLGLTYNSFRKTDFTTFFVIYSCNASGKKCYIIRWIYWKKKKLWYRMS